MKFLTAASAACASLVAVAHAATATITDLTIIETSDQALAATETELLDALGLAIGNDVSGSVYVDPGTRDIGGGVILEGYLFGEAGLSVDDAAGDTILDIFISDDFDNFTEFPSSYGFYPGATSSVECCVQDQIEFTDEFSPIISIVDFAFSDAFDQNLSGYVIVTIDVELLGGNEVFADLRIDFGADSAVVPLPGSALLFLTGLGGISVRRLIRV